MEKDKFGFGTPKSLLKGDEMPIPIIGEWLEKKLLSQDERDYFQIENEIGKDNMKKLVMRFSNTEVKKNPDLKLADFNKYAYDWMIKVQESEKKN